MALAAPTDASARHLAGRLGLVADRVRLAVERRRTRRSGPRRPVPRPLRLRRPGGPPARRRARAAPGGRTPTGPGAARRAAVEAEADAAESAGAGGPAAPPRPQLRPRAARRRAPARRPRARPRPPLRAPLRLPPRRRLAATRQRRPRPGAVPASARAPGRAGRGSARWPRSSAGGLLVVEDADRPFLTRALRVPDRVAAHLLGDATPDPAVEALATSARRPTTPPAPTRSRAASAPAPASPTSASGSARPR